MGIEPSSHSPDVVEIANDKYNDRPKPSKSRAWMGENRCEVWSFRRIACGNVAGWNSTRLRRTGEIVIEQVASEGWYGDVLRRLSHFR